MFRSRSRRKNYEIDPDEIFLDSSNLPEYESSQFEGRITKPVSRRSVIGIGIVFGLVVFVFGGRALDLQVVHGATFADISQTNTLNSTPIFAMRGLILDRNGTPLAWNAMKSSGEPTFPVT